MIKKSDINPNLLRAEYAVRGPIVDRAQELEEQGKKIIYCNIGNPQALKQKPLTYLRQILSLLEYPELLSMPETLRNFPADVVGKVKAILRDHPFGTGAYSQSAGISFIRKAVAEFISARDGIPADKENIILTDGASKGVQSALMALLRDSNDGVMIPIPQYPLYSATIALYGGKQVGYYVDETNGWQLTERALNESLETAKRAGIRPVAIAVINPGNPTGAVLSHETMKMIVAFARRNMLSILADEVYQDNVYSKEASFRSFAKVLHELGEKEVSLFSFHSVSKGLLGECGHRGGYAEFRNIPAAVRSELIKLQSISLCANLPGQIATYVMVAPPRPGEESYGLYVSERQAVFDALKAKARLLGEGINKIEGMSVVEPEGAMYAFVKFDLPSDPNIDTEALSEEACRMYEARRDTEYCLALLEETGICVVPGSGFGQVAGTLHFRTTFLPPMDEIEELVRKLKLFHERYCERILQAEEHVRP
ncbi:MAG TPA: aminotransferase class I/II-fold pyridoxal phosphate-dependent enzyme [Bacteroidota bacterium]|nr:aminotransferase class I/II-fold pyridoxal phosphate-dependent enzyme [Bacteroidota bacterium]